MLNYNDLYMGFVSLMDTEAPNFKGHPSTAIEAAENWTHIFEQFYLNMVMPIPGIANANLYPSLNIFKASMLGAIQGQQVTSQFAAMVSTLHLGVCTGVNMLGIYATTPNPVPLIMNGCFQSNSAQLTANLMATQIFTWVIPTFSIITASGAVIKWL